MEERKKNGRRIEEEMKKIRRTDDRGGCGEGQEKERRLFGGTSNLVEP